MKASTYADRNARDGKETRMDPCWRNRTWLGCSAGATMIGTYCLSFVGVMIGTWWDQRNNEMYTVCGKETNKVLWYDCERTGECKWHLFSLNKRNETPLAFSSPCAFACGSDLWGFVGPLVECGGLGMLMLMLFWDSFPTVLQNDYMQILFSKLSIFTVHLQLSPVAQS